MTCELRRCVPVERGGGVSVAPRSVSSPRHQGVAIVAVRKAVGVASGGTIAEAVGVNVAVEPGSGVGVSVPGGVAGATVPVGSTSNVAVSIGWMVGVETVS